MYNSNLILKYLEIMQEQEKMIKELGKSNLQLIKENEELKNRCRLYRENTIEWKRRAETFESCLLNLREELIKVKQENLTPLEKYAKEQYERN